MCFAALLCRACSQAGQLHCERSVGSHPQHPRPHPTAAARTAAYTIGQFQSVTQLHQIMLVVTIFLVAGFMVLLYR